MMHSVVLGNIEMSSTHQYGIMGIKT